MLRVTVARGPVKDTNKTPQNTVRDRSIGSKNGECFGGARVSRAAEISTREAGIYFDSPWLEERDAW